MLAKIRINATFVKFQLAKQISRSYAFAMLQYFIQFSANAKHFSTVLELLLWLPEFRPYSRVANSLKRSFSLSRTLLPFSSVEAPTGYPYKNSNNRNEQKRESARGKMEWMRPLFSFLTSLSSSSWGERPASEGDLRKRLKFMQALTPVVQKLTNPTLRIILYPKNSVTGWVIDYIVTDFTRNMMIRIYEKDVSFIRNQVGSKEKKSEYSKMQ